MTDPSVQNKERESMYRPKGKAMRRFLDGSSAWVRFTPSSRPWRLLRTFLVFIKEKVNNNPWIKEKLLCILKHFPTVMSRLKRIGYTSAQGYSDFVTQGNNLTPRAQEIYSKLQNAIAEQQRRKGKCP